MCTKEEYYSLVLGNRRLAADEKITRCSCTNTLCEWHGKCKECVALHRYHGDHIPVCLQSVIKEKIKALAESAELEVSPKQGIVKPLKKALETERCFL